jgi:hypothetical protein
MVHLTNHSKYLARYVKKKGSVVPGRTRPIGAAGVGRIDGRAVACIGPE